MTHDQQMPPCHIGAFSATSILGRGSPSPGGRLPRRDHAPRPDTMRHRVRSPRRAAAEAMRALSLAFGFRPLRLRAQARWACAFRRLRKRDIALWHPRTAARPRSAAWRGDPPPLPPQAHDTCALTARAVRACRPALRLAHESGADASMRGRTGIPLPNRSPRSARLLRAKRAAGLALLALAQAAHRCGCPLR